MMTASRAFGPTPPTVGAYLAQRLRELGSAYLFGLPGDFSLGLLDELLSVEGMHWVGSANELNAAYAADGYARLAGGVGAFVTTFGVGELSALNGLAGSFAERVPVVEIVGMPSTVVLAEQGLLHHSLADGDHGHFVRMAAEVTLEAVVLDAASAAETIDRVLARAVAASRPVYIGVPADVAIAPLDPAHRALPITAARPAADTLAKLRERVGAAVGGRREVVVLAGAGVHRAGAEHVLATLAALPGVRIAEQSSAKALLDESHPAHLGCYAGAHTRSAATRAAVEQAPCLVLAGVTLSDFMTGFFTHRFAAEALLEVRQEETVLGGESLAQVSLRASLEVLVEILSASRAAAVPPAALPLGRPAVRAEPGEADPPLTHARFWPELESWLSPGTTLIAEAGTAFYGAAELRFPDDCVLLGQPVWSSIGYTLPATLGAMLARPDRRAVLIIGDGSAQLTIQELGVLLHRGLAPVVIVLNNAGYTVERMIRSPTAPYHDVVRWRWTELPSAFGADGTATHRVETPAQLRAALEAVGADPGVAALIEVVLPVDDAPESLRRIAAGVR